MLACIACSKRLKDGSLDASDEDGSGIPRSPASRDAIENLAAQISDTALKLSGAHTPCAVSNPCREGWLQRCIESEAGSKRGKPRGESSSSTPAWSISSASSEGRIPSDRLCANTSSGLVETMTEEEDDESKEWISQVEPGVLITLVSRKGRQNELKRIRFSRELFNKLQAQRWWAENCDKIMELYNVHAHAKDDPAPVPTPKSEDESDSKTGDEFGADRPVTPPMQNRNLLPRGLYASDDLQGRDKSSKQEQEEEQEWVEEDEPGVYITIHCYPTGSREIKRVKFGREKFSEMQAKLWWEQNRVRIHEQYIFGRPLNVRMDC